MHCNIKDVPFSKQIIIKSFKYNDHKNNFEDIYINWMKHKGENKQRIINEDDDMNDKLDDVEDRQ